MSESCLRRYDLKSKLLQSEASQLDRLKLCLAKDFQDLKYENKNIQQSWNNVLARTIRLSKLETFKQQQLTFKQNISRLKELSTILKANNLDLKSKQTDIVQLRSRQQQVEVQLDHCQKKLSEITLEAENVKSQELADLQLLERFCFNLSEANPNVANRMDSRIKAVKNESADLECNSDSSDSVSSFQSVTMPVQLQNNQIEDKAVMAKDAGNMSINWESAQKNSDLIEQANSKTKLTYQEGSDRQSLRLEYILEPGRMISIDAQRMCGLKPTRVEIHTSNDADCISLSQHREEIEIKTNSLINIS